MSTRTCGRLMGMIAGGVLLLLANCRSQEPQKFIERPLPVMQIDSVAVAEDSAFCYLRVQTPTPCYEFARAEVSQSPSGMVIKIIGRVDKDQLCAQVIGSLKARIPLPAHYLGRQELRFWKGPSASLDTTLIHP